MAAWRARRSSSMLHAPALAVLMVTALLLSPPAVTVARAKATALIVFGDSTVDAGNNNAVPTLVRSNFPPYGRDFPGGKATGRFSNGRVATDFLSEALGLGRAFVPAYLDPAYGIQDFAIGVCFASASTGLDDATAGIFHVISMSQQMDMFREYKSRLASHLGAAEAEAVVAGAVYVLSIGSNDLGENYFAGTTARHLEYTLPAYMAYLIGLARGFLSDLYALGARKVGFTGLGAVGCVPLERARFAGLVCDEVHNAVAQSFNAALKAMVEELRGPLPGFVVRVAEVYALMADFARDPGRYGFERADVGCCGTGRFEMGYVCNAWDPLTCPDASKYVFWDAVHTTDRANQLIAEYLMNTTYGAFAS